MGVDCDAQPGGDPIPIGLRPHLARGEALLFNPAGALLERRVLDASPMVWEAEGHWESGVYLLRLTDLAGQAQCCTPHPPPLMDTFRARRANLSLGHPSFH